MPRHAPSDSYQPKEVDEDAAQRRALILSCNRHAGQARRAVNFVSVINAMDFIDQPSHNNPIERILLQPLTP